ncbi:hypothetical protein L208DRAFT_1482089 [Tricholoma matsutake]|nr:hypothetical protein L208DRAFT_1482089 [Tricholoma matsutake 945]
MTKCYMVARSPPIHARMTPYTLVPPVGVFNWHYIQCVLKKNSPPPPISKSTILPFHTRDNDDDESDVRL